MLKSALLFSALLTIAPGLQARNEADSSGVADKRQKFYRSSDMDWFVFSTTRMEKLTTGSSITTLRFTAFPNFGMNFNYDITNNIGLFTGINMKNIGFIEKTALIDSTIKRRVLTIGMPLGIKFGNFEKHTFGFLGGGVDLPFHFKEKMYIRRGNKDKLSEWFSNRTARIMPYVFAGFAYSPGVILKFQFYPGNFLNNGFVDRINTSPTGPYTAFPYADYARTTMLLFSIGFDIHYKKKKDTDSDAEAPEKREM